LAGFSDEERKGGFSPQTRPKNIIFPGKEFRGNNR